MIRCFGDSFFYLAYVNRRDNANTRTVEFLHEHDPHIVTTAWVLTEVGDALAGSKRKKFGEMLEAISADPKTKVVPASQELFESGVNLYLRRQDKDWPLTDCISFVVMEQEGVIEALTGDRHFEQAGFRALLRQT
jgi:predicted nucleic acid-binding protein